MTDTPITQAERDELKRLHAAATPAPWMGDWDIITEDGDPIARTDVSLASDPAVADNDGPLIVAARNALPRLLAALEAAEKDFIALVQRATELQDSLVGVVAERDSLKAEIDMAQGEAEHAVGGPRGSLLTAVREVCQDRDSPKAKLAALVEAGRCVAIFADIDASSDEGSAFLAALKAAGGEP